MFGILAIFRFHFNVGHSARVCVKYVRRGDTIVRSSFALRCELRGIGKRARMDEVYMSESGCTDKQSAKVHGMGGGWVIECLAPRVGDLLECVPASFHGFVSSR